MFVPPDLSDDLVFHMVAQKDGKIFLAPFRENVAGCIYPAPELPGEEPEGEKILLPPGGRYKIGWFNLTHFAAFGIPMYAPPENKQQQEPPFVYPTDVDLLAFRFRLRVKCHIPGEEGWWGHKVASRPFVVRFVEPESRREKEAMVLMGIFLQEREPRNAYERKLLQRYGIALDEDGCIITPRWRYALLMYSAFSGSVYGTLARYWLARELAGECSFACYCGKGKEKEIWYELAVDAYKQLIKSHPNTWFAHKAEQELKELIEEYEEED